MLASELLGKKWLEEHEDINLTGIAYDSRNVLPGNVFVCIKGFETDGHKYASAAVKNGAVLVVAEDMVDVDVPVWYVENSRTEIAEMACKYYDNPSKKFKLIGVTGTNGKTTITYLIRSIIEEAGLRIGVIGTNQNIIGDKVLVTQSTTPTTPNALELQQLFAEMEQSGADGVVMEVSSHALELERVHGCHFDVGVFTNLTRDHLDFHKTMENYLAAKAKLFDISAKGVVNFDDEGGKKIAANAPCDIIKVGLGDGCDLQAENIRITARGTDFDVISAVVAAFFGAPFSNAASEASDIEEIDDLLGAHSPLVVFDCQRSLPRRKLAAIAKVGSALPDFNHVFADLRRAFDHGIDALQMEGSARIGFVLRDFRAKTTGGGSGFNTDGRESELCIGDRLIDNLCRFFVGQPVEIGLGREPVEGIGKFDIGLANFLTGGRLFGLLFEHHAFRLVTPSVDDERRIADNRQDKSFDVERRNLDPFFDRILFCRHKTSLLE